MAIILGTGKDMLLKVLKAELAANNNGRERPVAFSDGPILDQKELEFPFQLIRRAWW